MELFGINHNEILEVKIKEGYTIGDKVIFRVTKRDVIDLLIENGGSTESNGILNPTKLYIYNNNLHIIYQIYFSSGWFSGGNFTYSGDYMKWFREKKLQKLNL
jgi:hypothetical protein